MKSFVIALIRDAGTLLMRHFGTVTVSNKKQHKDIVTKIDFASEKKIISAIKLKYPSHAILSEEIGLIDAVSDYQWVIDPIDATVNYTAGIPLFSISIGLVYKGQPILGAVFAPYLDELFFGEKKKGAYLNNKRIKPSTTKTLDNAIINMGLSAHYSPALIKKNWDIAHRLSPKVRGFRMFESGALTSCYVACGRLDGKISIKTDPFGNAASTILIQEAGGIVADFQGNSWNEKMKTMICSNKPLFKKIQQFVK